MSNLAPAAIAFFIALALITILVYWARSVRERNGDTQPRWNVTPRGGRQDKREPLPPFSPNPFDSKSPEFSLPDRITAAVEVCQNYGRHVIVLYIRLEGRRRGLADAASTAIRSCVRKTDHVEALSANEFVVAVVMVREFSVAGTVLSRIQRKFEDDEVLAKVNFSGGGAMSPLYGYSGEALIESARAATKRRPRAKSFVGMLTQPLSSGRRGAV